MRKFESSTLLCSNDVMYASIQLLRTTIAEHNIITQCLSDYKVKTRMLPVDVCRRNINKMWGYALGRAMWIWICGVMANTSVSNTEALGSTPCKSVFNALSPSGYGRWLWPTNSQVRILQGQFIREYPRGDGIRLIHVNAVGSSPTSRTRTRLRRIRSLSHPILLKWAR